MHISSCHKISFTKYKRIIILFIILFSLSYTPIFSQRNGLIGKTDKSERALIFTLGPSYCFGDVGGSAKANANALEDIQFKNIRYAFSLGFRQSFNNRFGYRISLHQGLYSSTDKGSRYDQRGYAYNSNIFEVTALGEFNPFQGNISQLPYRIYIYGGAGVAAAFIHFTGKEVSPPNSSKTSEVAPVIPFGFGYEMGIKPKVKLGLEVGWQYAFSTYMDGIKTKSGNNDFLGNISFTLAYKLSGDNRYDINRWYEI